MNIKSFILIALLCNFSSSYSITCPGLIMLLGSTGTAISLLSLSFYAQSRCPSLFKDAKSKASDQEYLKYRISGIKKHDRKDVPIVDLEAQIEHEQSQFFRKFSCCVAPVGASLIIASFIVFYFKIGC